MRTCLLILLACLAVAGEAPHPLADADDLVAKVPDCLASMSSRDRAWGAWRAGQLGMEDQVPRLRELLKLLIDVERLDAAAAKDIEPVIAVTVKDQRAEKTALPELPKEWSIAR